MAARLPLLVLAVVAASLLAADARPCHTFFVAFRADPNPSRGDDAVPHHLGAPHVATVITVFRVRRLGPHVPHGHRNHHHLHSIPANVRIHRPDLPHPAAGPQERARDIFVVVIGLLFGVACGALTAASVYLVWSMVAGAAAVSAYDELYDDEDEASDIESPKKVGYVIIQELEVDEGGKN
ncbi:hypothetical protein Zm00014a_004938 [Zea mays]|uniref:Uncharacterized protein n=2 Tax=Zea mays TaxID=4577 RepID=B6SIS3_MAIZE|nr:uncharacterized protein LOC100275795 precursor [Zea mays]ACG24756.1 hypothetical protein [Zea mays]ACG30229.1 hypothetical protein [Zea mays]ACG30509.1 hypothetical protein [Zea mays]ACN27795.1 unknown [Zea mays]ONM05676.1 hypothetical protein ZEAMMB73_Zm00001d032663 [Zea mays]|eukprot:NP_001143266.1 uncharacterized protein LOC100275795 precursor [Zea mays]